MSALSATAAHAVIASGEPPAAWIAYGFFARKRVMRFFEEQYRDGGEQSQRSQFAKWYQKLPDDQKRTDARGNREVRGDAILPGGELLSSYLNPTQVIALPSESLKRGGDKRRARDIAAANIRLIHAQLCDLHPHVNPTSTRMIELLRARCGSQMDQFGIATTQRRLRKLVSLPPDQSIDGRYRSGRKAVGIDGEMRAFLEKTYLEKRLNVAELYEAMCAFAAERHERPPFCKRTLLRWVKNPKNIDPHLAVRMRQGPKAFENTCVPYILRDYSKIRPFDIWSFDGTTANFLCKRMTNRGIKAERPTLIAMIDMGTRECVAAVLCWGETWHATLGMIKRALLTYGIPETLYYDNGSGFLKACGSAWEERTATMTQSLSIRIVNSIPGAPRGRGAIERFMGTLGAKFAKLQPGFTGTGTHDKPEGLDDLRTKNAELLPTIEQAQAALDRWVAEVYNRTPHSGDGMLGRSPVEAREARMGEVEHRIADPKVIENLTSIVIGPKMVRQSGIHHGGVVFGNNYPPVNRLIRQRVYLRIDAERADCVTLVHDKDGDPIIDSETGEPVVAFDHLSKGVTHEDLRTAQRTIAAHRKRVREDARSRGLRDKTAVEIAREYAAARGDAPAPVRIPGVARSWRVRSDAVRIARPDLVEASRSIEQQKTRGDARQLSQATGTDDPIAKLIDDYMDAPAPQPVMRTVAEMLADEY
ncbi:MAG: hypothetical protein ACKVS9_00055 [Phycisphaerae bacterium]